MSNIVSKPTPVKAYTLPYRTRRYKLNDRLSLDYARHQGYTAEIFGDGYGTVTKPDGTTYHISDFVCDCPDAVQRDGGTYKTPDGNYCKHSFWINQLSVCACGKIAELMEFEYAKHEFHHFAYVCECDNERTVEQVKKEREQFKEDLVLEMEARKFSQSA